MPRQTCYTLTLGARNTRAAGRRFLARDDALVREITFRHFPSGFTVLHADGGWFDPERGRFRAEESRQIIVTTQVPSRLRAWCRELATALGQKELLVVEVGPAAKYRA